MWINFLILLLINTLIISAQHSYGNKEHFTCFEFGSLESCLEKVEKNTVSLNIEKSNISRIPRHAFKDLGTTLKSLKLQFCGIKKIDPEAFFGLRNLEKLDLSSNKLTLLESTYFNDVPNLKHLDVSFNEITAIDDMILIKLPSLTNFYFDYNKVLAVSNRMLWSLDTKLNLRNVRIGKNPMNWENKMLLTKKFDDHNINYIDDWENWNWLSRTIRDCEETQSQITSGDQIMNCAIENLLEYAEKTFQASYTPCVPEAEKLKNCAKGNASYFKDIDGVRLAFEGLAGDIIPMKITDTKFHKSEYMKQLEYQTIHYNASPEDWAWFEDVIKTCSQGKYIQEEILDCEVYELLNFASSIFEKSGLDSLSSTLCNKEVQNLLQCSAISPNGNNTVRRSIQGFGLILPQMGTTLGKLDL